MPSEVNGVLIFIFMMSGELVTSENISGKNGNLQFPNLLGSL